jgi:hypothetical protein
LTACRNKGDHLQWGLPCRCGIRHLSRNPMIAVMLRTWKCTHFTSKRKERLTRHKPRLLAATMVGSLALSTFALAQTGAGSGSSANPGAANSAPGSSNTTNPGATDSTQGQRTGSAGRTGTMGQGVGGQVGGDAQKPGGTSNDQMGTQSHDAQKGGSGTGGAR